METEKLDGGWREAGGFGVFFLMGKKYSMAI